VPPSKHRWLSLLSDYLVFNSPSARWRQVWVNAGDIVLVGLRDYPHAKADVILK
jgi:translation initiation factor IF-1